MPKIAVCRIIWFRAFTSIAQTEAGRAKLKALLDGTLEVPVVQLQALDRWGLVTSLLSQKDPDAERILRSGKKAGPKRRRSESMRTLRKPPGRSCREAKYFERLPA